MKNAKKKKHTKTKAQKSLHAMHSRLCVFDVWHSFEYSRIRCGEWVYVCASLPYSMLVWKSCNVQVWLAMCGWLNSSRYCCCCCRRRSFFSHFYSFVFLFVYLLCLQCTWSIMCMCVWLSVGYVHRVYIHIPHVLDFAFSMPCRWCRALWLLRYKLLERERLWCCCCCCCCCWWEKPWRGHVLNKVFCNKLLSIGFFF